jgi:multiple sugar transport system substrate-binding protein
MPKVPEWERIATFVRLNAEAVVNGRASVDEALRNLNRQADQALEKRRWLLTRDGVLAGAEP